ncbi:MAG: hypothetical protein ABI599_15265 [Flavobacteriales bacterium]
MEHTTKPLTQLEMIRARFINRCSYFKSRPVRLVPTMSPGEVVRQFRQELPVLFAAMHAAANAFMTTSGERLVSYNSTAGNAWWVVVQTTATGTQLSALVRYRTPAGRINAVCFSSATTTAHHYAADLLEPLLKPMRGDRDPHQRLGRFLLLNHQHHCDVVANPGSTFSTVITSLQDELVLGTLDPENDVVCYAGRFGVGG